MRKVRQILKEARGMTLLEVLITLSIVMLLMFPITDMLLTSGKLFNQTQTLLDAKSVAMVIEQTIKEEVRFASKVELSSISNPTIETDEKAIYIKVEDGKRSLICKDESREKVLLGEDFIGPHIMSLSFRGGSKTLGVEIQLEEQGERRSLIQTSFQVQNLSKFIEPATGSYPTLIFKE